MTSNIGLLDSNVIFMASFYSSVQLFKWSKYSCKSKLSCSFKICFYCFNLLMSLLSSRILCIFIPNSSFTCFQSSSTLRWISSQNSYCSLNFLSLS